MKASVRNTILGCWAATFVLAAACTQQKTEGQKKADMEARVARANSTIADFKAADPDLDRFFTSSTGYAVFPSIGVGAFIIGGGHGEGVVYEKSGKSADPIGTTTVTMGSIGAQIGGQAFAEIIFFQEDRTLANFKASQLEFSAQASAVAVGAGASARVNYENGVAVFVKGEKGLMAQASIGGQKFTFKPK